MRSDSNIWMRLVTWTASTLAFAAAVSADGTARVATWASKSVGPDGPWNAVEISLGQKQQTLSLFPGRQWETVVVTSDYCSLNSSISHCGASTYSKDRAIEGKFSGAQLKFSAAKAVRGVPMVGANLGTFNDDYDVVAAVPNCSLALVDTQMLRYPDGQWYLLFAGCLSLGSRDFNHTFSRAGQPGIDASIYPWWLENNTIPSTYFGIHIGTAAMDAAVSGSLSFEGYDKNRIAGDILTSKGHMDDIQHPPFDFDAKIGLLAAVNSTISTTGLNVSLDGCSPYLTLPQSTCAVITSYLPVVFNNSLSLYLWNTADPKYKHILGSASALSFSISSPGNDKPIVVNIPFQHLSLTLTAPLVSSASQDFPYFTGGTGVLVLGRVFMQDAFVGGSYDNDVWWLAQAPGPNIALHKNVVNLARPDKSISGSGTSWAATWDSTWSSFAAKSSPHNRSVTIQLPGRSQLLGLRLPIELRSGVFGCARSLRRFGM